MELLGSASPGTATMYDARSDEALRLKAQRMARTELSKRYRAEYWALCGEFFDQLKTEQVSANA